MDEITKAINKYLGIICIVFVLISAGTTTGFVLEWREKTAANKLITSYQLQLLDVSRRLGEAEGIVDRLEARERTISNATSSALSILGVGSSNYNNFIDSNRRRRCATP